MKTTHTTETPFVDEPITTFLSLVAEQRTRCGAVAFSYPLVEAWKAANNAAGATLDFSGQPTRIFH